MLSDNNGNNSPLIVVGLPRSGSSLIADLLSQTSPYYVFDDLYFHQKVRDEKLLGFLTEKQIDDCLFFLGWQIRARIRFKNYSLPKMLEEDVDPMNQAIKDSLSGKQITWDLLQKEWLIRLAKLNGKTEWGYNFPKSFLYYEDVFRVYPDAKFLFLFRHPESVFASYKYMLSTSFGLTCLC